MFQTNYITPWFVGEFESLDASLIIHARERADWVWEISTQGQDHVCAQ